MIAKASADWARSFLLGETAMRDFRDKVAVITGAGSGIGRALAKALAARGAHLALSDIDEAGLAESARMLAGSSTKVTTQRLDVAVRADVEAHAERVVAEHGRVNLVFNNAGVGLESRISEMSSEDLEWLMGINFWGVVYGTKAFLPHLKASGDGHVINISSVFGIIAVPGQASYNAAKFAVRGYTEALRQELEVEGWPVSATCVHPGGIKTNIARNSRMPNVKPGQPSREELLDQFDLAARTTPERCAEIILRAVERNRRRVLVGADAKIIDLVQRLFPTGYQRLLVWGTRRRERSQ